MRSFVGGVLVLGMFLTFVALAQTTAPATPPAADQSTPQGTLILLTRAMQSGESESAKPLLHAVKPDESALAEMLVQSIDVNAHFKQAVAKAFGDGVADMFVGGSADLADAEKRIAQSKVTLDKDNATIEADAQSEPVKLVRVDNKWKLLITSPGAGELEQAQKDLKMRMDVMSQVTNEVGQGKYKSPEELSDALRSRLAMAMLQAAKEAAATSQPATMPLIMP